MEKIRYPAVKIIRIPDKNQTSFMPLQLLLTHDSLTSGTLSIKNFSDPFSESGKPSCNRRSAG
jgi:hypothetical protein